MGDRLRTAGWDFAEEALCFNCRSETVQEIRVTHKELITSCTNCGAEAHYVQFCSCEGPLLANASREYGAWRFTYEALCPRCGNKTANRVFVDTVTGVVACGKCRFTRLYRFDMFNKRWRG